MKEENKPALPAITGIYKDKRLWADWPEPILPTNGEERRKILERYNSSPSWEVSPQLQAKWVDGHRYEEGKDFDLRWTNGLATWLGDKVGKDDWLICIPIETISKTLKEKLLRALVENPTGSIETIEDKPKERMFTLKEMRKCFKDARWKDSSGEKYVYQTIDDYFEENNIEL